MSATQLIGSQADQPAIAELLDRQAALQCVHELFWGIDARLWDVVTAACAPEIAADWPGLGSGAFAAAVRALFGGATTHHQCTNPVVTLDANGAEISLLVVARHRRPTLRGSDHFLRASVDQVTLRRISGRWAVTRLRRAVQAEEGNPGVLARPDAPAPPVSSMPLAPEPAATTDQARLARLLDHKAIHDLMMRFGRGLDTKDWELYRSCFADEVAVDFAQSTGHPPRRVAADSFVAFARMRQHKHAAFHQYSNFQASVDGDRARCILYLAARHRATDVGGDPINLFVGWYDNAFVRTPAGWRISALRHPLQWVEGNASIKDAPDPDAEALGAALFATSEDD